MRNLLSTKLMENIRKNEKIPHTKCAKYNNIWVSIICVSEPYDNSSTACATFLDQKMLVAKWPVATATEVFKWKTNLTRWAGETGEPREFSISSRLIKVFAQTRKKALSCHWTRRCTRTCLYNIVFRVRDAETFIEHSLLNVCKAWARLHSNGKAQLQNAIIICALRCSLQVKTT